jgi:FtsZ-interacting cell division protein ZipA
VAVACLIAPAANGQTQSPPAQTPAPSSPAPDRSAQSPDIPDQKLDAAAVALQKMTALKRDYEQRVVAASDSDKQRIVDEANNAITKAVTDQGLSVEEYITIMVMAQNDPQVRSKLIQRLPQSDNPTAK